MGRKKRTRGSKRTMKWEEGGGMGLRRRFCQENCETCDSNAIFSRNFWGINSFQQFTRNYFDCNDFLAVTRENF